MSERLEGRGVAHLPGFLILRSERERASRRMRPLDVRGMRMPAFVYILRCSDGSYYVGSARKPLEQRLAEHNSG